MSIKIVHTLPEQDWRLFVDKHPDGNIFHTPEMFHVFARAKGHQPALWTVVDDNGCPLALLPIVQVTLMNGLLRRFTTRSVVYGSVLCTLDPEGKKALRALLRAYKQGTTGYNLFTELRNLSDLNDLQPILNEQDFIYEEHLNFLTNLNQPEEVIWRKISKGARQSIRTSRNKGLVIEEINEQQEIKDVYPLLQDVYARVQVPLASLTLFQAAFDVLAPHGMFKIFVARMNEHYAGTCFLLLYKGRIIYWYAGSNRAFSAYAPTEALIWHTLLWGKEHHFDLFDFGGAGKPGEDYGPGKFKAKFGGDLVNYGRNICIQAPLKFRLSQLGYQFYRRFFLTRQQSKERSSN